MTAVTLTETNAGVVADWCRQHGAVTAVVRGGPKGGSIGGSVIVRTTSTQFVLEPGDVVRWSHDTGIHLAEGDSE